MWSIKRIVKRIFSKRYRNVNSVSDVLTNTNNNFINPQLFIGSNFIGGGILGTSINISSSIINNILNFKIENKDRYFKQTDSNTIELKNTLENENIIFRKQLEDTDIITITFKGILTSIDIPHPPSFTLEINNKSVPIPEYLIDYSFRQITNMPRRFRNEYRGFIVLTDLNENDVIYFSFKTLALLNGGGVTYSLSELVKSSDNLQNTIDVFVTE